MDVSKELQEYAENHTTATIERAVPVEVDAGLLAAFDTTPVEAEAYSTSLEPHLLALTLTSTHSLLSSLFSLPTHSTPSGPTALLPTPTTLLPREKPLPKPKPLTKWERFAKEKGISHKKREKHEWDEERGEWVARWGRDGKNREKEDQWIHEVKAGEDADQDPAMTARKARKDRIAKNERQHARNLADAASAAAASGPFKVDGAGPSKSASKSTSTSASGGGSSISQAAKVSLRAVRKAELERSMLVSKTSTASLGKFDKAIEGEPRAKGVKRKFEANEDVQGEKDRQLQLLKGVERGRGRRPRGGREARARREG
ncbi:Rhodanese- sulfurtransferase [Saitozyma podzolica]|uniref:Ribosome biogenesis regulatory protein n=1 Tax=Saitozyma podzolica TaxID=1890683 RepID=A0A427XZ30_9TREE|nr:Rhodanese- sulfurtransferase [Saitozyma podzolica]